MPSIPMIFRCSGNMFIRCFIVNIDPVLMRSLPNHTPNHPLFGPTRGPALQGGWAGAHDIGAPRAVFTLRSKSTLSALELMPKVFGDIVTTPAVTIEMMSPDQVAPFEGDGPEAATALPAAAKNRNNSPTTNIFPVFVISNAS